MLLAISQLESLGASISGELREKVLYDAESFFNMTLANVENTSKQEMNELRKNIVNK
jgi:hypothetical protein